MSDFEYRSEYGELMYCYSCDCEAPLRKFDRCLGKKEDIYLCELCASTHIRNAFLYPDRYRHDCNILKTIAQVGNIILDQVTDRRKDIEP